MRILLTHRSLAAFAGTECYVRDVCRGLRAAGEDAFAWAPALGEVAQAMRAEGTPVHARLEDLPCPPDVIHGQFDAPTMAALARFPSTPAVFFVHNRLHWEDEPPAHPAIRRWVAVDLNCRERLEHLPGARVRVIRNAVDLERFAPRGPLPERPGRALLYGNAGTRDHVMAPVREACERSGIALDGVGAGAGRVLAAPERALPAYDLVFAKARCALEALAVGCAVVLCDVPGVGPHVTSADLERLRDWNLGMRLLTQPHDPAVLRREIDRYDARDAAVVSARIRAEAGLPALVGELRALYGEVIAEGVPAGAEVESARAQAEFAASLVVRRAERKRARASLDRSRRRERLRRRLGPFGWLVPGAGDPPRHP